MELRVRDDQNALTSERVGQSVDYWRSIAQQVASDSEAAASEDFRKAHSKMAAEQAALFLNRNHPAEAEQTFRYALEILPTSPEVVFRYANLLVQQGRLGDAATVAGNAAKAEPKNEQFRDLSERLNAMQKN